MKIIDIFRNILCMQTPNRNYNGRNNFTMPLKMSLDNWVMASLSGFCWYLPNFRFNLWLCTFFIVWYEPIWQSRSIYLWASWMPNLENVFQFGSVIKCIHKKKSLWLKKRVRMCLDHCYDNESSIIDGFCW